jgi:hypothetical protein
MKPSRLSRHDVRHSEIGLLAIRCRAPLDAAERTALPGAILPEDLAVLLRIHRERHARLLSNDDHVASICTRQHRRASEIMIGAD